MKVQFSGAVRQPAAMGASNSSGTITTSVPLLLLPQLLLPLLLSILATSPY